MDIQATVASVQKQEQKNLMISVSDPFPLFFAAVSGTSWRVPDEAGVGSEAVPDSERLSLRERRHQPPEPAAPLAAGGV